jgi:hypothetical protein
MTVTEYRVKVLEVLNADTTGTAVLDTHTVNRFVRDGAIRAYTDIGIPKGKKIALVKNTGGYLVDAGLLWIRGIVVDTADEFMAMREIQVSQLSDANYYNSLKGEIARPGFYIRHGDSIRIYPIPQATDSIYVFYFARAKYPAANADTVTIGTEQRFAVIYAAAAYCCARAGRSDKWKFFEDLYTQEVMRLRSRFEFEGLEKK